MEVVKEKFQCLQDLVCFFLNSKFKTQLSEYQEAASILTTFAQLDL